MININVLFFIFCKLRLWIKYFSMLNSTLFFVSSILSNSESTVKPLNYWNLKKRMTDSNEVAIRKSKIFERIQHLNLWFSIIERFYCYSFEMLSGYFICYIRHFYENMPLSPIVLFFYSLSGKSFDITYIRIVFYSPRPESFAIYKRQTSNGSWIPYQYYRYVTCICWIVLPLIRKLNDRRKKEKEKVNFIRISKKHQKVEEKNMNQLNSWMSAEKILSNRVLLLGCVLIAFVFFFFFSPK